MRIVAHRFRIGWRHFWRQLTKVIKNPIFLALTVVGNTVVISCGFIFYLVESGVNPQVTRVVDGFWWAIVTVTTVGYGDIVPATLMGRGIAVLLMITGTTLFLSFIALLSSAFVELEFLELESEVQTLKDSIKELAKGIGEGKG